MRRRVAKNWKRSIVVRTRELSSVNPFCFGIYYRNLNVSGSLPCPNTNPSSSTARASLEEDYAKKMLSLSRKNLGSNEGGSLKASMDIVRGEVEAMAKAHQNIAAQMRHELEEPLAAFAGAIRERRKIVQGGGEKLLKTKTSQTNAVNKVLSPAHR